MPYPLLVLSVLAAIPTAHVIGAADQDARLHAMLSPVAGDSSNRTMAAELFGSEAGVKTHLSRIHDKLGVADRAAAVATACRTQFLG